MINLKSIIKRSISGHKRQKSIVVLAYHRICEFSNLFYDYNISATPGEFRNQMEYIKANYNVISSEKLISCYSGRCRIPDNSIMITFDDGFKDTIHNAYPILMDMQLPAVLFVATDFIDYEYIPWEDEISYLINNTDINKLTKEIKDINEVIKKKMSKNEIIFMVCKWLRGASGKDKKEIRNKLYSCAGLTEESVSQRIIDAGKNMMNKNDLKQWVSAGLEVGAHTCSHPQLSSTNESVVELELIFSKYRLENIISKNVQIFAYPYGMEGYYNDDNIRLVRKTGYDCAFSMNGGLNTLETNRYDLRRVGVAPYVSFNMACNGYVK